MSTLTTLIVHCAVQDMPLLNCIISKDFAEQNNVLSSWIGIRLANSTVMWLKASFEEYVENGDIIVSSSLFGYMSSLLSSSSPRIGSISISCEVAEILTEVPVAECSELVIRPLRLYKTGHLLEQPGSWSSTTPTLPVSVQSLIGKHFRDLCNSYVFSTGSHILLPFLNSVVAFEIVSSTASHSVFFISSESHIKVETIYQPANSDHADTDGANNAFPKSEELSSLYRPLIFKEYYFLSEAVNRAMFIFHSLAHNNEYCSNNSVLFQGPKGVGKSFLMKALAQYCHINLPLFEVTSNTLVEVVCIDCQEIIQKNIRPSLSVVQSEVTLDEIIDALKAMVVVKHRPSQSVASKIVLFVDHLDEILGLFAEESMQDRAALSNASLNNTRHYLAFLLHHLLMQLRVNRSSTNSYISITVIGATRLSTQLLPRANLGSPEFQLIVQIPKPTRQDREQLWLHMLDNYCQLCSNDFVFKAGSSKSSLVLCGFPATDTSMSERDQWAKALTGASRGYLPGDLMGILETAANISYKKQKQSQDRGLDYPDCRELQLDWNSMLQALAEVPPASVLDLSLELLPDLAPTLTWDHFVGYENAKQQVQRIAKMIQYKSPLSASSSSTKSLLGKKRSIGMVVHGVSGCGKSLLVQTMAKETKMNFVSITGGTLLSKYFGDTEARIRSIFQRARNAAPCILYFDNFDALAHRRGSEDSSITSSGNIGNRILSTFLNELDGIGSELAVNEGTASKPGSREGDEQIVFVVVSCSDVQQLDEALVRPGRLQYHVHIDYPNNTDIYALLSYFLRNSPLHTDVDLIAVSELISSRCDSLTYKQKYLSVSKLMDMKEKVISTVLEEYLQSNPDLYARLRMESKNMLLESKYLDSEQALVHVSDVSSLEICAYHIQTVLDQVFPKEAPKFQFSEPFSGNFSFNVGSTV